MIEFLTRNRRAAGSSLTGITALWSLSKVSKGAKIRNRYNQVHIYPSLVLVQSRKTRPYLTERLLMGRKESNQTKISETLVCERVIGLDKNFLSTLRPLHTLYNVNEFALMFQGYMLLCCAVVKG